MANLLARQVQSPLETYQNIATIIFGIQAISALQNANQRDLFCGSFSINNLGPLGFNALKLNEVICQDIPGSSIPIPSSTVANSLQLYNDVLWVQAMTRQQHGSLRHVQRGAGEQGRYGRSRGQEDSVRYCERQSAERR